MSREEAVEKWDNADIGEQRAMLTDPLGRDTYYLDPYDRAGFRTFNPKRVCIKKCRPDTTARPTVSFWLTLFHVRVTHCKEQFALLSARVLPGGFLVGSVRA
jgi:hypothetical protein